MSNANPQPDPRSYEAFLIAEAYAISWRSLRSRYEDEDDIPVYFKHVITMNAAFCCESYLKALIFYEGTVPPAVHNLRTLFKVLDDKHQAEIRKRYGVILRTDPTREANRERIRQAGKDPDKILGFDRVLDVSALAFEKSRYPYDPKHPRHEYLAVPIEKATRQVIVSIRRSWDGAFEGLIKREALIRPRTQPRRPTR